MSSLNLVAGSGGYSIAAPTVNHLPTYSATRGADQDSSLWPAVLTTRYDMIYQDTWTGQAAVYTFTAASSALSPGDIEVVNQTPNILQLDGLVAKGVSTGTGSIAIRNRFGSYVVNIPTSNVRTRVADSYVTGSLINHVNANVDSMIDGKSPSDATQLLLSTVVSLDVNTPNVTRNANLFTAAYDATAITITQDVGVHDPAYWRQSHPGILISPRHIYGANHWKPGNGAYSLTPNETAVGAKVVFLDSLGAYHTRTIIAEWYLPVAVDDEDQWVGYLDAPITTITPMQVLPADWLQYMPSMDAPTPYNVDGELDVIVKGSFNSAGVYRSGMHLANFWTYVADQLHSGGTHISALIVGYPVDATKYTWRGYHGSGQSGSPVMLPINGKLVLCETHWTSFYGTHIGDRIARINAAMNTIKSVGDTTTYALNTADLSGFIKYRVAVSSPVE